MTADHSIMLLYSPFPDMESARATARSLLERHLVACCNLLPGMESHYVWEGALTHATEMVLLCKTSTEKAPEAAEYIASVHPYSTPAILTFPATANPDYAVWVTQETRTLK